MSGEEQKRDLTFIGDLGEFEHIEDVDVDRQLGLEKTEKKIEPKKKKKKAKEIIEEEEEEEKEEIEGNSEETEDAEKAEESGEEENFESASENENDSDSESDSESTTDDITASEISEVPEIPEGSEVSEFSEVSEVSNSIEIPEESSSTDITSDTDPFASSTDITNTSDSTATTQSQLEETETEAETSTSTSTSTSESMPPLPESDIDNKQSTTDTPPDFDQEIEINQTPNIEFTNTHTNTINTNTSTLNLSSEQTTEQTAEHIAEQIIESDNNNTDDSNFDQTISTSLKDVYRPEKIENLKDIHNFAKDITYGEQQQGGQAPYSIVIKNIIYQEDAEDILGILREFGIFKANNAAILKRSIATGQLLIPQLNEYTSILLVHKLRRFHVDISMGLSEEIHPPKIYTNPKGFINKHVIKQNRSDSQNLQTVTVDLKNIILATTSTLEQHQIIKYLGIVSEHILLSEDELLKSTSLQNDKEEMSKRRKHRQGFPINEKSKYLNNQIEINNDNDNNGNNNNNTEDINHNIEQSEKNSNLTEKEEKEKEEKNEMTINTYYPTMDDRYKTLSEKLKPEAQKLGGNAIIGINYQMTPLMINENNALKNLYKITCTGNVVLVK